jgi:hypothetical protein
MANLASNNGERCGGGLTRRDFVRLGSVSIASGVSSLAGIHAREAAPGPLDGNNCIVLFLVGGPSHLETFDLKPNAPDNVRGPFRPIQTTVPGMQICEHLPLMARMADRFAIVRSVHHQSAPVHETGQQLMQTGRLSRLDAEHPHYGAVVAHLLGPRPGGLPPFTILPGPIGNTGIRISHGQGAGYLGPRHEPVYAAPSVAGAGLLQSPGTADGVGVTQTEPPARLSPATRRALDIAAEPQVLQNRYGPNTFGRCCLVARRLVEHGVRVATVNMFDTVYDKATWDCHADDGSLGASLDDYRTTLCPMFDRAYTALLQDLHDRGLLQTTLVVAMGEFGRTPYLNARGGRDHWPGVWSTLFAGGGVRGGQVIGASDPIGAEPRARPVTPAEVAATVYRGLGIDPETRIPGPSGQSLPLADAQPVQELFG